MWTWGVYWKRGSPTLAWHELSFEHWDGGKREKQELGQWKKEFEGFERKLYAFFPPRKLSRQNNRNWPTRWNWSSLALVVDIYAQRRLNLRLTPLRDTIPSINPDYSLLEESTHLLVVMLVLWRPSPTCCHLFLDLLLENYRLFDWFSGRANTCSLSTRSHLHLLTSTLWGKAEGEERELYFILFPDM